jgi:hypothetical protein
MQTTAAAPAAVTADDSHKGDRKVNSGAEFLYRVAERFGLPVVILVMVLAWARNDIVQPLLDAHFEAIRHMTEGQKAQTAHLEYLGRKMDELIDVSSQK